LGNRDRKPLSLENMPLEYVKLLGLGVFT
jgi:hypothetical protein